MPLAMGRLLRVGCSRSVWRSIRSLMRYNAEAQRLKAMKQSRVANQAEEDCHCFEASKGRKMSRFLNQCRGRSATNRDWGGILVDIFYSSGESIAQHRMRLLHLLTYYWPHWTGLTRSAAAIAEGQSAMGHDVEVVACRHDEKLASEEVVRGVKVRRVNALCRFSRGLLCVGFVPLAVKVMRSADVVILHTPLPESLVFAVVARCLRKPVMMVHHGDVVMPPGVMNRGLEWVARFFNDKTASLADVITSYSEDYAKHSLFLRPYLVKVEAVTPPVKLLQMNEVGARELRERLGLCGVKVIGFAGRWVREKGFDVLLRAYLRLREKEASVKLLFAGETRMNYESFYEENQMLIDACGDDLVELGLLRNEAELVAFYGACDVFAMPSRTEMFGLVQLEAMQVGTSVVASNIPGARVLLQRCPYGLLVDAEDVEGWSRALWEVLTMPQKFKPVQEDVFNFANEELSLARYEEILLKLHDSAK